MNEEQECIINHEEAAYRRGYHQGFTAARNNPDVAVWEVNAWRYDEKMTHPPGSLHEGKEL